MYKIKLTNNQVQGIYSMTDNKEKQAKIMSILAYLMKYTDAETMQLMKSLNRLYIMYLRYHNYIARSYFYKISKELIDNALFLYYREDKKRYSLADKIYNDETIDTTYIDDDLQKPNNIISNITNTYTLNTTKVVKSELEKVNAIDLVDDVFKTFKVKSKVIKSLVIAKLQNTVLDAAGAVNYIVKVLTEKTEQYNLMRVKYAQKVAKTKYSKSKNNFVSTVNARTFNNFKSREYDYDMLEERLVYGGYNGETLPL